MDLIAGPNRAAFAQEVAEIVLEQLRSTAAIGYMSSIGSSSSCSSSNSNHHHNHLHDNNGNDDDNDNEDADDNEGESDLLAYMEKDKKSAQKIQWTLYSRNSKMSKVKCAIDVSKKTVAVLWHRWHFSDENDPSNRIPPWSRLDATDFIQQSNYRKGKVIIKAIMGELSSAKQLPKKPIGQLTIGDADALLDKGIARLVDRYLNKKQELGYTNVKRPANVLSMSFISFYDYVNINGLKQKEAPKERGALVPVAVE